MSLLQRLRRVLEGKPSPYLSFHADPKLIRSLEEYAARQQRPAEEIAADLISSALAQRSAVGDKLERWLVLSPREKQVAAW